MGSNEEYLDDLLKSILNDENSEEQVLETEAGISDLSISDVLELDVTIEETEPSMEEFPELDLEELLGEASDAATIQAEEPDAVDEEEQLSEMEELPETEQLPEMEELPETEQLSEMEELPETEQLSEMEELHETEQLSEVEELPEIEFDMAIEESYDDSESESPIGLIEEPEETQVQELQMEEPEDGEQPEIELDMAIEEVYDDSEVEPPIALMEELEEATEDVKEQEAEEPSLEELTNMLADSDGKEDDELAEISGLINHSKEEMAGEDEDMLAFLESMAEPNGSQSVWGEEEDEAQPQSVLELETEEEPETENALASKEKKGFFGKLFNRKKKKEKKEEESNEGEAVEAEAVDEISVDEEGAELADESDLDEILSIRDVDEKPKKENFFTKIVAFLTSTGEEEEQEDKILSLEPSEENQNILEELEEEDKKKKKKKVKKGKGKESKDDEAEEKIDPAKAERERKKNEKQELKAQKRAEKKEREAEEARRHPHKPISKKNIGIIAAISITIGAVSIMITLVIPSFLDKGTAREAFYNSDFSTSYILLYGKNLDDSDTLIFTKSKIIMEMNRKLDSYHSYSSMDKPLEALDALMAGIARYEKIAVDAEANNVSNEVRAIYDTMLSILNDKYGLSEGIAKEINLMTDDLAYTRKLKSIVFGTPYVDPAEEAAAKENTAVQAQPEQAETPAPEAVEPAAENMVETPAEPEQEAQADAALQEAAPEAQDAGGETPAPEAVAEEMPEAEDTTQNSKGEKIEGIKQPIRVTIKQN